MARFICFLCFFYSPESIIFEAHASFDAWNLHAVTNYYSTKPQPKISNAIKRTVLGIHRVIISQIKFTNKANKAIKFYQRRGKSTALTELFWMLAFQFARSVLCWFHDKIANTLMLLVCHDSVEVREDFISQLNSNGASGDHLYDFVF